MQVDSPRGTEPSSGPPEAAREEGALARLGIRFTNWAERWFPDAFVFVAIAVVVVALGALANGAPVLAVTKSFGDGFWSLIPFTMQMAFVTIGGYVVATSPPVQRLIDRMAMIPKTGRGAVGFVAAMTMLSSFLSWGLSLIFGGLLAKALARRTDLRMDYRAAGAAAYLGLGATWALGLSSSAAQLQANPKSLPPNLLAITGVIPFSETIFLWQSILVAAVLFVISVIIATVSAPGPASAVTAQDLGVDPAREEERTPPPAQPGEWLEHWPILSILLVLLGGTWIVQEFARQSWMTAISNLNTYNLIFITLGLLLHWRPINFLKAVARSVPATAGILIQFPLYAAISAMLTGAKNAAGTSVSDVITHAFVSLNTTGSFPVAMGVYSAVLGFFVPSGGGKWLLEAPYVMQAANELKVHLGWAVMVYNAAEALPNLINPFFMLPLLGVLGLKARDIVGFSFLQLIVHLPVVLFLLWALAFTLTYHPPVMP
ncbi:MULTISPECIES: TIGR00366 family protein [Methylobacterium]|uniref:Short-chain fatty acid transporter n=3 Tax=Pseudomonadota TaxID=1224 RepID=A0ABQ4T077_9HYPH|nr:MULTISPECIES: TIGR00366 family protein [Methylobacterium]PIU05015.1 MAG: Short chain fatty acid transporter [Methylobacterium sp. CG09_land_8_20_14_0_10_71_15]PIU11516.1 MAG: Short chain fatty acid transporter [Methylobacterium sp. CG08_land_8_20_14_0_20_71_15]GBU16584.1 short chain fatty acid transporter [Methylobacterium sp.]GJE07610.1 Putative short-chain fatty acid transporter [Methylobacterium jeotgali]